VQQPAKGERQEERNRKEDTTDQLDLTLTSTNEPLVKPLGFTVSFQPLTHRSKLVVIEHAELLRSPDGFKLINRHASDWDLH
jgi:hypothetical protein